MSEQVIGSQKALVRKAILLSWFTIIYNVIEGVVSIYLGIEEESMALAGFGGDSFIEVFSALLVLWRFKGEHGGDLVLSVDRERIATKYIGVLFLLLAALTLVGSIVKIMAKTPPETTLPGLIISSLSLSFMFFLWRAKQKVAVQLDSSTVEKDARCSLACIKLSFVLFVGSLTYLLMPQLWWADSLAALVLVYFIGQEGLETIKASRSEDFSGGCGCA